MNQIVKPAQMFSPPAVGTRDGNWVWNGSNWVCDPDCFPPTPCPPFGPPVFSGPAGQPPWYPGANGGVSFSQTPPPNPVRGHFWWDGTSLFIFDGAAWDVVGAGSGTVVTPPGSTFPTNPQPGEQFFDGKTLWIWDGKAWVPTTGTKTYIQATAPPAPNPGDTWFNGTQFFVWDGSAWEAIGPGATVGPVPTSTIVFKMISPTVANPPANNFNIVPFTATPIIDTQGMWDSVTHKITPKLAGNYLVWTKAQGGNQSDVILRNDSGALNVNDTSSDYVTVAGSSGGINEYIAGSGAAHMNGTTDFMRMFSYSTAANWIPVGNAPAIQIMLMP